jgi:hypothetical protein
MLLAQPAAQAKGRLTHCSAKNNEIRRARGAFHR